MDLGAVRCECGGSLQIDCDETGRPDLGHYHCTACGISYYRKNGVWMIDRATKKAALLTDMSHKQKENNQMTLEELVKDQGLFESCMKEVEEKVRAGQDPEQAKLEVLRAHGVQFDEDAVKARLVGRLELNPEELANVTGGIKDWCVVDNACYYAAKHHDENVPGQACAWNYECFSTYKCSNNSFRALFG